MIQAWLIRQIPLLVLSAGILLLGYWIGSSLVEQGRNEIRPQLEKAQQELAMERAARIRNEEAIGGYLRELESLRSRPRPSNPIRLCVVPAPKAEQSPGPVNDPAPATGSSAGEAGADLKAGPDIGPELRELAFQCDIENAKLRALQGWVLEWTR